MAGAGNGLGLAAIALSLGDDLPPAAWPAEAFLKKPESWEKGKALEAMGFRAIEE